EDVVATYRENEDFEGFRMACILNFATETAIDEDTFKSSSTGALAEQLYNEAANAYDAHKAMMQQEATEVFEEMLRREGPHMAQAMVQVPFRDGRKEMTIYMQTGKVLESKGRYLTDTMERNITLAIIDESWKEHLRAMDDLKQSVQTVYLEQKDPLVVYKVEAFNLFRQMSTGMNREIVSFLCHAQLPSRDADQQDTRILEGRPMPTDMSQLQENKAEIDARGQDYAANEQDYYDPTHDDVQVKQEPVRVGPKVGRNDPCPCGSGKKYKNCHGKDE
ncbi:MAG: preprotein translocase subunit SecA, partial [Chitinophagaceae bacterium]